MVGVSTTAEIDPASVPARCRGKKAARLTVGGRTYAVRQHPAGRHGMVTEFAVHVFGPGGGWCGSYCTDDHSIKQLAKRADGIQTGSIGDCWPTDRNLPTMEEGR